MTRTLSRALAPLLVAALGLLALAAVPTGGTASAAVEPLTLVGASTTWAYLDDNTEPHGSAADVLAWTAPSFDDSRWKRGRGGFGARSGRLAAVGGYQPVTLLKQYIGTTTTDVPTFFFRTRFDFDADAGYDHVAGRVVHDDAVRVYVNGTLAFRHRDERATDATKNLQYAGIGAGDPAASDFTIDPALLRDGPNTIAVALYQDRATSSDVYFELGSLVATDTDPAPTATPTPTSTLAPTPTPTSAPTTSPAPTTPLVTTAETTWAYLDDNTEPPGTTGDVLAWTRPAYDHGSWKRARGSFGARSGRLTTVGPYLPATLLRQYVSGTTTSMPTYFFRTTFTWDDAWSAEVPVLRATLRYDDAVRVYVNGRLGYRHLDERATDPTRNLQYAGKGYGDPTTGEFFVETSSLVDGANTVAVALYQDRGTSSDIYLDFVSLTPVTADVGTPPERVVLTPTATPEDSQAFSWMAVREAVTSGAVEIRPVDGTTRTVTAYDAGTVNGSPLHHFAATVTGLSAATTYEYRVGAPGAWSRWRRFTTADPTDTSFSFIYYGDAQVGLTTTWPEVVAQSMATAPHAVGSVHAGDLVDSAADEVQWTGWFAGMGETAATTNVLAAPGNHEYTGDHLLRSWKASFEYPHNHATTATSGELAQLAVGTDAVARQYAAYFDHWSALAAETVYYVDYQDVRFITLNATRETGFLTPANLPACTGTGCPVNFRSELWIRFQAAWLDEVLAESTRRWHVVTFHQPVYSASVGRDEPVLRKHWVPLFQRHDVDLVMMGHDHVYARGYDNVDATATPGLTTGPVYMVTNAGAKHYDLTPAGDNVWTRSGATQVRRGEDFSTYQVVDVTASQLRYRSYVAGRTATSTTALPVGAVWDEFTITRNAAGKWVTEPGVTPPG